MSEGQNRKENISNKKNILISLKLSNFRVFGSVRLKTHCENILVCSPRE